jgi:hypothetical protein
VIRNGVSNSNGSYYKLHKRNFQHLYPEDIRDIFLKSLSDQEVKIDYDKYREGEAISTVEQLISDNGIKVLYKTNQKDFCKIPGSPFGYWLGSELINKVGISKKIIDYGKATKGLDTCDNNRFVRDWHEVSNNKFSRTQNLSKKWFVYSKGGPYKKWYGNNTKVVNWADNGEEIKNFRNPDGSIKSRPQNLSKYFKDGITWSAIGSNTTSYRVLDNSIFGGGGNGLFPKSNSLFILGLLNSKVSDLFMNLYNPTLNNLTGDIHKIPIFIENEDQINSLVENLVEITKKYDESIELNNEFISNSLIGRSNEVEESFELYKQFWRIKFFQLHKGEEKVNNLFIEIYDLKKEVSPEVQLKDLTILRDETTIENGELIFDQKEIFSQFISYAVGCMFGRYSLDKEGLILANQGETLQDYLSKIEKQESEISFLPDEDNIIPILDDEWFEDDIVGRFHEFLRATFGDQNFEKNLSFIEDSIGKDIRKYFVKDFYKDHIQRYKKRPIYWMFSSPKGSFNVLVYMHRYTPDTLNQILNGYLNEYREKLKTRMETLDHLMISGSPSEQNKASKEKDKIQLVILELQEYEREVLYPLATERISIDLDNGVLVNYNMFGKAIAPVAGLNDKKTKEKVMEFDWIDVTTIR